MEKQYLHREVLYKKTSPFSQIDAQIAIMQDLLKHKSKIHAKYVHYFRNTQKPQRFGKGLCFCLLER